MKVSKIIILILGLSYLFLLTSKPDLSYDAPRYICLGISFAKGIGYKFIFTPDKLNCFYNNFLFPLIISPIIKLFGLNYIILRLFIIILSWLVIISFYFWLKRKLPRSYIFFPILLLVSNPLFIRFSNRILTEIPYLLLTILFFISFEKWRGNKNFYLNLFLLFSIFFLREIGITLLIVFFIFVLLKRKNLTPVFILLFIILGIVYYIQTRVPLEEKFNNIKYFLYQNPFIPQKGYITFKLLISRIIININFYYQEIGKLLFNFNRFNFLNHLLVWVTILGFLFKIRNKPNLTEVYFSLYFIFILFWPWQARRFLIPIIFLIIYYLSYILFLIGKRYKKITILFMFILALSSIYQGIGQLIKEKIYPSPIYAPYREWIEMGYWIKNNLKKGDYILSSNPEVIYLISKHKGIKTPYLPPDKIYQTLNEKKIKYILADNFDYDTKRYLFPFILKYRNKLKIRKINGSTILFEIKQY